MLLFTAAVIGQSVPVEDQANTVQSDEKILADGNILDGKPSQKVISDLIAKTRANLIAFKAGEFEMGDWGPQVNEGGLPFDGPDSKPLHKVRLDAFSIGKFPVTYAEFDVFTAAIELPRINQASFVRVYRKPTNPAGVSWQGAHDYCQWLGTLTEQSFSLPTEAQWEYAARSGGRRDRYPTDNGALEEGRNFPTHEQEKKAGGLVPVDSFPPNAAGVYYMSAGVRDWTNDWYDKDYYERSPSNNPKGPAGGKARVMRGHFGSASSAMTFKRWKTVPGERTGSWTKYFESGMVDRQVPYTKYSSTADTVFRCVLNE
jgi:formylglycine-generating enzyme required for sulfatase activity